GEVSPREALVFSWVLTLASVGILALGTNWLATAFGIAAIIFYVVIYSLILKRRTEQNIIWGRLAGAFPVLIAWVALRSTIEWTTVVLFVVIFLWHPPDYWPLSRKFKQAYQEVDVPMLGSVATCRRVSSQLARCPWATVIFSLL